MFLKLLPLLLLGAKFQVFASISQYAIYRHRTPYAPHRNHPRCSCDWSILILNIVVYLLLILKMRSSSSNRVDGDFIQINFF